MSLIEDVFKGGNIVSGLAVGIGIAVVAPVVLPVLRPLAKSAIKAGLVAYDQGRVALAEMAERTEDILAEARRAPLPSSPGLPRPESGRHDDASTEPGEAERLGGFFEGFHDYAVGLCQARQHAHGLRALPWKDKRNFHGRKTQRDEAVIRIALLSSGPAPSPR